MAIQARWAHQAIAVPDDDDGDPFRHRVEEVGVPLELTERSAELNLRIAELVTYEGALYNAGLHCSLKDRPDTCCNACPVSAHADPSAPLQPLCALGREQERVVTEMAVAIEARGPGSR